MKRTALVLTLIITLLVLGIAGTQVVKEAKAETIIVPDNYATIQEAVDNADDGFTIHIQEGTYSGDVNITKSISLKGQRPDSTIIKGCIFIRTSNVTISSIKLMGFGRWEQLKSFTKGYGIATISGKPHTTGSLQENWGTTISNCIFENWIVPIALMNGDGERVINNTILNSDNGIDVNTFNNLIAYNKISCGLNGIMLGDQDVTGNIIHSNHISGAEKGILINSLNYENYIVGNTIAGCQEGIHLGAAPEQDYPCSDNLFFHNNLLDNSKQVLVTVGSSNTWDNGYPSGGNYWSSYMGLDANSDGIGDSAYVVDGLNQDRYPLMEPYKISGSGSHIVDFTNAFRDSEGKLLATLPSSFKLVFPNGTTSSPLSVGSYLLTSGLTVLQSIVWQESEIKPKGLFIFDSIGGNPQVNCSVYSLTVDPTFYDKNGYIVKPSSWTIRFPNSTEKLASSRITFNQTQTGEYKITNIVYAGVNIEADMMIRLDSNMVWTPEQTAYIPPVLVYNLESNSAITESYFNETSKAISFVVSGPDGTSGYAIIRIEKALANRSEDITVYFDDIPIDYSLDSDYYAWILTFNYTHSSHRIVINLTKQAQLQDLFPTTLIVAFIIIVALAGLSFMVYFKKRKHQAENELVKKS
jgi:nitrous oxidase accessory protein